MNGDYHQKRAAGGSYNKPETARDVTQVGTGQLTVTTAPQQISYASRRKAATRLTNLSSSEIFYGTTPDTSPTNGDLLPAGRGQWVSIPGGSVIFVVVATGTARMAWAEAYE